MQRLSVLLHHMRLDVIDPVASRDSSRADCNKASTLRTCFDVWTQLIGARGVALLLLEGGCVLPSVHAKAAEQSPSLVTAAPTVSTSNKRGRGVKQQQVPAVASGQATFQRLDAVYTATMELVDALEAKAQFDYLLSTFIKVVAVLHTGPSIDDIARRLLGEDAGTAAPGAWAALVEPVRTQMKMLQAVFHCCFVELLMSSSPPFCMPHPLLLLHNSSHVADRVVTIGIDTSDDRTKPPVMRPFRLHSIDAVRLNDLTTMCLRGQYISEDGRESQGSGSSPIADPPVEVVRLGSDVLVGALWVPGDPAAVCLRDVAVVRGISIIAQRTLGHDEAREAVRVRRETQQEPLSPRDLLVDNLQLALLAGLLFAHMLPEKAWKVTDTLSSELSSLLSNMVMSQPKPSPRGMLNMGYSFCLVQPQHHALLVMYGVAAAIVQRASRGKDLSWLYAWRGQIRSHPVLPSRLPKAAWEFLSQLDVDGDTEVKVSAQPMGNSPHNAPPDAASPGGLRLRRQSHSSSASLPVKRLRCDGPTDDQAGTDLVASLFATNTDDSISVAIKRLWLYAELCATELVQ